MAIEPRQVTFTVNVDTGKLVKVEKAADVVQTGPDPTLPREAPPEDLERSVGQEIADIKRGTKRYLRVAEIIQTTESPGCVYWDGVRWVKYC